MISVAELWIFLALRNFIVMTNLCVSAFFVFVFLMISVMELSIFFALKKCANHFLCLCS